MSSLIITWSWQQPIPGGDAKVVWLSKTPETAKAQEAAIGEIIAWAKEKAGRDWGDTIAQTGVYQTAAIAGDYHFKAGVAHLATNLRYDTGEGIYDERRRSGPRRRKRNVRGPDG